MYDPAATPRPASRQRAKLSAPDAGAAARLALERVRKLLSAYVPGMTFDLARLKQALATEQPDPVQDMERSFALGWLGWLEGDWQTADAHLAEARRRCEGQEAFARCAYWCARVRALLGQADAVAEYELALKRLGGSPQATAWYVDLLWRTGRTDRAEQVWKSVRGNKRVFGCDEGPLLETRALLRRGELGPAEKMLREMVPSSGVVHIERQLLLAWALVGLRKTDQARDAVARAEGPYPASVLADWRRRVEARLRGESLVPQLSAPGWRDYVIGQEARRLGQREQSLAYYRAAVTVAAVAPYAIYALACVGEADPRSVLALLPGAFFATRARTWHAVEQFRHREIGSRELLEATDQAVRAGVEVAPFTAYRVLAQAAGAVALADSTTDPTERRNALRLALEQVAAMHPDDAQPVLTRWMALELSDDLREAIAGQLLRVALRRRDASLLTLVVETLPPATLARARTLLGEQEPDADSLGEGVRLALCLVEAAQRFDYAVVAQNLEDPVWRSLPAPPRFVLRALAALVAAKPSHSVWTNTLPRWLGLWTTAAIGAEGEALSGGVNAPPPAGVAEEAWCAHQAARALLRDDPTRALAFLRRVPGASVVPAVERLAQAQRLSGVPPALLSDMVDLLRRHPAGNSVLACPPGETRERLGHLTERSDLPGRLLHHLALVETRLACGYDDTDPLLATLHGRRAWNAWLGFLASSEAPPAEARRLLIEHLVAQHRLRVEDHLSRDEREPARSHWQLVTQLPGLASQRAPGLAEELKACVERFRDELATDFLLSTREAMRFGDIPEGWRADYERGLGLFQRLLALDRDNVRLLTAFVEICDEWFFDLYRLQDRRLFDEVDRHAGVAEHLAELVADGEGAGAARAALSDYWKFRGFASGDRRVKRQYYEEALRLNPGNDNARALLAELEADDA